jgi:hypothetical protein
VPSEARSEVAVVPFFNRPVLRTGADITIRLADANGNPITSVAEFRLDVTRDGESVATLLYDPAKPSESNEYRFRFAPTVDGPYLLTPVVRMAPTAEPVAFTPIAFTSEAPSIRIGYPVDQANRPIPGAFDIELHGLSGIRGLELHVLTDGLIDPESIVIDPEGLFGPGAIADWYVTTGLYDDSDQLYDELVYTVIANGDGTPTDNPARPYVLVRVTGLYHPEATALVLIAGTKVILADGLHLPFSAGGFVDAIQLN